MIAVPVNYNLSFLEIRQSKYGPGSNAPSGGVRLENRRKPAWLLVIRGIRYQPEGSIRPFVTPTMRRKALKSLEKPAIMGIGWAWDRRWHGGRARG